MDKSRFQYEGLKWLHELELLNHPQVINTLRFNILITSKHIKEVELLIYRENKTMLVLLELSWFGRKFFKRKIFIDVQDSLTQLLPSFRFRVTDDPKIMELAVERVKKALTGGKNENVSNISNGANSKLESSHDERSSSSITGRVESTSSDSEKQQDSSEVLLVKTSTDDSSKS